MKTFPELTFDHAIQILYFHLTEPIWKFKLLYNAYMTENDTSSECIFAVSLSELLPHAELICPLVFIYTISKINICTRTYKKKKTSCLSAPTASETRHKAVNVITLTNMVGTLL